MGAFLTNELYLRLSRWRLESIPISDGMVPWKYERYCRLVQYGEKIDLVNISDLLTKTHLEIVITQIEYLKQS